jgi:hypothetical protein
VETRTVASSGFKSSERCRAVRRTVSVRTARYRRNDPSLSTSASKVA